MATNNKTIHKEEITPELKELYFKGMNIMKEAIEKMYDENIPTALTMTILNNILGNTIATFITEQQVPQDKQEELLGILVDDLARAIQIAGEGIRKGMSEAGS